MINITIFTVISVYQFKKCLSHNTLKDYPALHVANFFVFYLYEVIFATELQEKPDNCLSFNQIRFGQNKNINCNDTFFLRFPLLGFCMSSIQFASCFYIVSEFLLMYIMFTIPLCIKNMTFSYLVFFLRWMISFCQCLWVYNRISSIFSLFFQKLLKLLMIDNYSLSSWLVILVSYLGHSKVFFLVTSLSSYQIYIFSSFKCISFFKLTLLSNLLFFQTHSVSLSNSLLM